jgi:hypothetical protein
VRDRGEIGLQLISLVLKLEHFISEIMLDGIGIQTVISESKLHGVLPNKFNADVIEHVVTAATEYQESQEAYNAVADGNPSTNIESLYGALYFKGRL